MITQAKLVEDNILNTIQTMTDPVRSAFSNVGRTIVCAGVTLAGLEMYGNGMPRTNTAINKLLAEGKIVRTYKGRSTYYAMAKKIIKMLTK